VLYHFHARLSVTDPEEYVPVIGVGLGFHISGGGQSSDWITLLFNMPPLQ
jgi:hypothetical protein